MFYVRTYFYAKSELSDLIQYFENNKACLMFLFIRVGKTVWHHKTSKPMPINHNIQRYITETAI